MQSEEKEISSKIYNNLSRTPSNFVEKTNLNDSPNANMNLEWIYGFRSRDCLDNLKYTKLGEIVYMNAATNIIYDQGHRQRFHKDHTDEIISLAIDPTLRFVGTGEYCKYPKLIVWDSTSMDSISIISGLFTEGICQLCFDSTGKLIAGVGIDKQHIIAIYDWMQKKLVYCAKSGVRDVYGCVFHYSKLQLITCGKQHIRFWTPNANTLKFVNADFVKDFSRKISFYSVCTTELYNIFGASDNKLWIFKGYTFFRLCDIHTGPVYALCSSSENNWTVISGSKDGKIYRWTQNTIGRGSPEKEIKWFDMEKGVESCPVRSLCLQGSNILIGTEESCIYEYKNDQVRVITEGHYIGELSGLAACPIKRSKEFATCSDDRLLRVWDSAKKKCLRKTVLKAAGKCLEYSLDGLHIAVGLADGMISIFQKEINEKKELKEMQEVQGFTNSAQAITDIKYTTGFLAAGAKDSIIYIYTFEGTNYQLANKCKGHSTYITHIDISSDGKYIQSTDGTNELLFWSLETGNQITNGNIVRDIEWSTWTVPCGWAVEGIWSKGSDGTDINAVCRNFHISDDPESETLLIATGNDYGKINIFNYPCLSKTANSHTFAGHSDKITNIRFLPSSDKFISVGGFDRSIFQWEMDIDNVMDTNDEVKQAEQSEYGQWFERQTIIGDEFMAVKPWLGAIKEPSSFKPDPTLESVPNENLELEWVHGYTTGACRNNLRYTTEGDIVYNAAALGIIYDISKHRMHFQRNHTDDIISLAISPSGHMVATGEIGANPKICIWDSYSGSGVISIKGFHKRGVACLSFSEDSSKLASVGLDDYHSIAIYRTDGTLIASSRTSTAKVLSCSFLLNSEVVTCGVNCIKFFQLRGSDLNAKNGLFGKQGKIQTILCAIAYGSDCVTGQADGSIYLWKGNICSNKVTAHNGAVNALSIYSEGMISGSQEGLIVVWGKGLTIVQVIKLNALKNSPMIPGINSVCMKSDGKFLLIGTRGSDIIEYNMQTQAIIYHNQGHYKGELWGLAVHPSRDFFATSCDDGTVRLWDARDRAMNKCVVLKGNARAIAYNPNGSHIALAMQTGSIIIYNSSLTSIIATQSCGKQWIQTLCYSPDGHTLAVGSHDCCIYLFNTNPYTRRALCKGHSSYITHLDFSDDCKYMQSNDGAYELLFWSVDSGNQIKSATSVRDVQWTSWTCTLGWPVQGIWPKFSDGTDINAVDRSGNKKILVTADDFGLVKLFKYPCLSKESKYKQYSGHSSHVTNIRFCKSQSYVISTGGNDKCIFQFKVT